MSRVIAVYGGSFDPPHLAHTLVSAYVLAAHRVDQVLVVPTAQHAFDKRSAPFEHRLRMCELAMRDLHRVEISAIEAQLPRPSLTLRLLEHLQQEHPEAQLRLVIGTDLLPETDSWHRFDLVRELAPPLIVPRAGYPDHGLGIASLPAISSTEVRACLRAGLSTQGLLSPVVADYAQAHALYR